MKYYFFEWLCRKILKNIFLGLGYETWNSKRLSLSGFISD